MGRGALINADGRGRQIVKTHTQTDGQKSSWTLVLLNVPTSNVFAGALKLKQSTKVDNTWVLHKLLQ